jgi:hypothetical protein
MPATAAHSASIEIFNETLAPEEEFEILSDEANEGKETRLPFSPHTKI